ncbi:MAG: SUMF1/EgtB/PvdO family nonheme iron enzyme [Caldilineaceae bacterium]|nr:SUMF1/EgtB/PvdO family nonheme iron enzyme [Caldilineaceae bacterium]
MDRQLDFGDLLDKYLADLDRSGNWLAQRLGVSVTTVTRWRNGATRPKDQETVLRIADVLNISGRERAQFFDAAGYVYTEKGDVYDGRVDEEKAPTNSKSGYAQPTASSASSSVPEDEESSLWAGLKHIALILGLVASVTGILASVPSFIADGWGIHIFDRERNSPVGEDSPAPPPSPIQTAECTRVSLDITSVSGSIFQNERDGAVYKHIPAGKFTMGSNDNLDEKPIHEVCIDEFWMKVTEVTNGEYRRCVESSSCDAPENTFWDQNEFKKHPVTNVDWDQAMRYAAWVGGRLPTEAEWEWAARGEYPYAYPWGNNWDGRNANFCDSRCGAKVLYDDGYEKSAPVGSFPSGASPFGILDMAGNVEEWVQDWYMSEYYLASPTVNPVNMAKGGDRVLRGGSFKLERMWLRASARNMAEPGWRHATVGFRVVIVKQPEGDLIP